MFVLFWGRKRREDHLGFVADFCPICREVRPFRLLAIRMVPHLFFIPMGSGRLECHVRVCLECGIRLSAVLIGLLG